MTNQGVWALIIYRFFNKIYRSNLPRLLKSPLLLLGILCQKYIEVVAGITLPYSATIGTGFYIGHHSGIIINSLSVIGKNCNISQGVTIGVSGRGEHRGVPNIGNHVYIGANATVVGKITVGDKSVIGANSLVTRSVEPGVTVLGVPAVKVSDNDSRDFI